MKKPELTEEYIKAQVDSFPYSLLTYCVQERFLGMRKESLVMKAKISLTRINPKYYDPSLFISLLKRIQNEKRGGLILLARALVFKTLSEKELLGSMNFHTEGFISCCGAQLLRFRDRHLGFFENNVITDKILSKFLSRERSLERLSEKRPTGLFLLLPIKVFLLHEEIFLKKFLLVGEDQGVRDHLKNLSHVILFRDRVSASQKKEQSPTKYDYSGVMSARKNKCTARLPTSTNNEENIHYYTGFYNSSIPRRSSALTKSSVEGGVFDLLILRDRGKGFNQIHTTLREAEEAGFSIITKNGLPYLNGTYIHENYLGTGAPHNLLPMVRFNPDRIFDSTDR